MKGRVTSLEYKFPLTRKFSRGRPPVVARTAHSVASILSTRLLIPHGAELFPSFAAADYSVSQLGLRANGRRSRRRVLKGGGAAAPSFFTHIHTYTHIHMYLSHLSSASHRGI